MQSRHARIGKVTPKGKLSLIPSAFPDKNSVNVAYEFAEKVQSGEIQQFAFAATKNDGTFTSYFHSKNNKDKLSYAVDWLKNRIISE